jgi:hypothetical protein
VALCVLPECGQDEGKHYDGNGYDHGGHDRPQVHRVCYVSDVEHCPGGVYEYEEYRELGEGEGEEVNRDGLAGHVREARRQVVHDENGQPDGVSDERGEAQPRGRVGEDEEEEASGVRAQQGCEL